MRKRMFSALASMLILAACGPARAAPLFQGLGIPSGASGTHGIAISADGSTVVGQTNYPTGGSSGRAQAFVWRVGSGYSELPYLPGGGTSSAVGGVSADGSWIVGMSDSTAGSEPARWNAAGSVQSLGLLPGSAETYATAVSADGGVLGGFGRSGSNLVAFQWVPSTGITPLTSLPGRNWDSVYGVSADGSRIAGQSGYEGGALQAVFWDGGGDPVSLGLLSPDSASSIALGISGDGSTVVGQVDWASGKKRPFRWTSTTGMQSLGTLSGHNHGEARAVSFDGSVVVGESGAGEQKQAFIWPNGSGIRSIADILTNLGVDVTGWQLFQAGGVSADGLTIAGHGRNPSGQIEAWVATIPEPSAALLLGMGLAMVAARRR